MVDTAVRRCRVVSAARNQMGPAEERKQCNTQLLVSIRICDTERNDKVAGERVHELCVKGCSKTCMVRRVV